MGAGSSAIAVLVLVISGFIFNLIFHPVRYFSSRAEGQKLFFMSAGSGILLGALVFLAVSWLKPYLPADSWPLRLAQFVNQSIPIPYAFRLILALTGSIALSSFLNLFSVWIVRGAKTNQQLLKGTSRTKAQRVYDRLTDSNGSSMAQLFRRAADKQSLVMLTLKSRKIYCGRIFEVPPNIDAADACIEILPSFSAYRDKDSLRMGEARTEYPVIELWIAKQRLYTLEENIRLFDLNADELFFRIVGARRETGLAQKFLRRTRRMLESQRKEAAEVVARFQGAKDFDIEDWIKVISIKEVESASFYDPDAYATWFSKASMKVADSMQV
ncbi:MAG: hypothetical protein ACRES5_31985 [Pseudomonas sp.]|uniref:hypothetical protein n=1 Tax=Stenotrophomonas sp. TaxID=69392 RepID=UPI003D6D9E35